MQTTAKFASIMEDTTALAQFKQGMELLRKGYPSEAVDFMRRAAQLEQHNPYYLSFWGLSVARAQREWQTATKLCETALSSKRDEAQFYVNLAEVYVASGRRDDAVAVLDRALSYCPKDARILRMRGKLGRRKTLILSFLGRGHFLNRNLGKLRQKISQRLHPS